MSEFNYWHPPMTAKPHIARIRGVWHCGVRGIPGIHPGHSPWHAYVQWALKQP